MSEQQNSSCRHLTDCQDAELIYKFVNGSETEAFEVLVRRHYNVVNKRLLSITKNKADADDLTQKLWLRVLENLPNYKDKQKFPNFLNTIATNLVRDEWRKKTNQQAPLDEILDTNPKDSSGNLLLVNESSPEALLYSRSEITYLVRELIPALPVKLRAVFLLRHESEYWDQKQPFQWQHLAELNGLSIQDVSFAFIRARDSLLRNEGDNDNNIDDTDRMIFTVWTQAQRFDKAQKNTETYLAELLGIPVNTFKTRYRTALAQLEEGMTRWKGQLSTM